MLSILYSPVGVIEKLPKMLSQDLYYYLSDLPRWHIFAIFFLGYIVYYLIEAVKVIANEFTDDRLRRASSKITET